MNHTLAALALALLLGPGISAQARSSRKNDDRKASVSWSAAADYATGTLADNFWRVPDNGFVGKQPPYHFTNGVKGAEDFPNNYWPQAHGMDVFIDAYLRAQREGDSKAEAFYKECFDKGYRDPIGTGEVKKQTGILWTSYGMKKYADISACFGNQFVDDMEWHALTLIRLYEATGEAVYLREAQKLYAQIWKAWDLPAARDVGGNGGFIWCYGKENTAQGIGEERLFECPRLSCGHPPARSEATDSGRALPRRLASRLRRFRLSEKRRNGLRMDSPRTFQP